MHRVRIFQPAKTATQSGLAKTKKWALEFERSVPKSQYPLMGWTSSADMNRQISLSFPTKEAAIAYAVDRDLLYTILEPKSRRVKPKSYADNFTKAVLS